MAYHGTRPKILVTSAAGKTGLPTALQLLEKGYPVRALVRRAVAALARMPTTRSPDADAFERGRDHVLLQAPKFAPQSTAWRARHDANAGPVAGPTRFKHTATA